MPFTTEQKANALLWIEALESGAYAQSRFNLQRTWKTTTSVVGYCCMGVACEVFRQITHKGSWVEAEGHLPHASFEFAGHLEDQILPNRVMEWLGMERGNPHLDFTGLDLQNIPDPYSLCLKDLALTVANDRLNINFSTIARALRRHYGLPHAGID